MREKECLGSMKRRIYLLDQSPAEQNPVGKQKSPPTYSLNEGKSVIIATLSSAYSGAIKRLFPPLFYLMSELQS